MAACCKTRKCMKNLQSSGWLPCGCVVLFPLDGSGLFHVTHWLCSQGISFVEWGGIASNPLIYKVRDAIAVTLPVFAILTLAEQQDMTGL